MMKLCRDCRWYEMQYCTHESARKNGAPPDYDPIDGSPVRLSDRFNTARLQRGDWKLSPDKQCGPEAIHWEARTGAVGVILTDAKEKTCK